MFQMNKVLAVAALTVSAFGLTGCGMGKKLVKELKFAAANEGGHLVAGFDTKVFMGAGALPEVKLPIYHPKNPSQFLGYLETHYDGKISVRIDVTEASKIKVSDGNLLPNGRDLPIVLPDGVVPVSIPVINSHSKVYLAVGEQNLMAGVAVTLVDAERGRSDWIRVLRQLPSNIFYPFTISTQVKGAAGMFTGDKVGVGVFAVKGMSVPEKALALGDTEFSSISLAKLRQLESTVKTETFGLKTQYPVGTKMNKIQRAIIKVRDTEID
jgi:hypothetical protein